MLLLIDNYDSFTYNLFQYLANWAEVRVARNTASAWKILPTCAVGHRISRGRQRPRTPHLNDVILRFGTEPAHTGGAWDTSALATATAAWSAG
jgi:anthranilate synthase component 2